MYIDESFSSSCRLLRTDGSPWSDGPPRKEKEIKIKFKKRRRRKNGVHDHRLMDHQEKI